VDDDLRWRGLLVGARVPPQDQPAQEHQQGRNPLPHEVSIGEGATRRCAPDHCLPRQSVPAAGCAGIGASVSRPTYTGGNPDADGVFNGGDDERS
jgi:hypothetical protein